MPRMGVGVEWLGFKGTWTFYIVVLLSARLLLGTVLGLESYLAWTFVNVGHAVVTFFAFHWIKGSPFVTMWNQDWDSLTWWEQLDFRKQATPNRKFCMVVVFSLFLMAYETTPFDRTYLFIHLINLIAFVVMVIAKLPAMDKVRIFGINK